MIAEKAPDVESAPAGPEMGGMRNEREGPSPGRGAAGAELASHRLRSLSEEITRAFAPHPQRTVLVLYDRDPTYLQAQWYLSPQDLARARRAFPGEAAGLRQVLRLRRLHAEDRAEVVASAAQRVEASQEQGVEGFSLPADGGEYDCELGLEADDGGWLLLVRSNRIELAHPSPASVARAPGVEFSAGPQGPPAAGLHPAAMAPADMPVEAALAAVGEPLYPLFPDLEPEVPPAAAAPEAGGEGRDRERSGDAGTGPGPQVTRRRPFGGEGAPGAGAAVELEEMPPPLLPSTSERDRPPELLGSRYDPRAALSSAALSGTGPPGAQPQDSDMELSVELIIRGRARPGARIDLFGHQVEAGADGRFFLRRSIEDLPRLSVAIGLGPLPGREHPEPE